MKKMSNKRLLEGKSKRERRIVTEINQNNGQNHAWSDMGLRATTGRDTGRNLLNGEKEGGRGVWERGGQSSREQQGQKKGFKGMS